MHTYYRSKVTGKLVRDDDLCTAAIITGDFKDVWSMVEAVEHPSVVEFLLDGNWIYARVLFHEIHGGSYEENGKMLRRIAADVKRFGKEKK